MSFAEFLNSLGIEDTFIPQSISLFLNFSGVKVR